MHRPHLMYFLNVISLVKQGSHFCETQDLKRKLFISQQQQIENRRLVGFKMECVVFQQNRSPL